MNKKIRTMGLVLMGLAVLMTGCKSGQMGKETTSAAAEADQEKKTDFLGDALLDAEGKVSQIGEAEEGWEAARDEALKKAESDGTKEPGESFDRAMAEEIIRLVNQEREKAGLGSLTLNETMMSAAETRAKEQKSAFSHTRPDGSDAFTVFAQYEIPANYRGENLACGGTASASEVMSMWMNSEGHRSNILNGRFSRIGVGAFTSGSYEYWCQLFAN